MKKAIEITSHHGQAEPLALIGIGCRFPGDANDPASLWELLLSGTDAISEVPPERWNLKRFYDPDRNKPGKIYTREGGFLKQKINEFDALFFGITPREAECMDPQQRLLLETSWEALEDAGIPVESIAGSNTGVFVGAFTLDHKLTQMGSANRDIIASHTAIGSTMTILSNRISYMLDLHGPSMSLDTACSSSLVAMHLASQAIWRGECGMALVGGVNVMSRPEYPIAMCKGGFLAPDGRSKSFDENADGYGRGEGAGVVVLKPLSAALENGDSIYALVRGTGVNQDGRTNGITVPNPDAQASLIQEVCSKYELDPRKIKYFEAHGTGTPVGDPLEAQALGSVVGQGRANKDACFVGSIKSTIGHTEAAAGVAGTIKAALCLSHRQVPPQANLKTPNPNIPFDDLGLRLPRKVESLAPDVDQIFVGINSFGYGGTNAHVILENAPEKPHSAISKTEQNKAPYVLPLSARSESGLTALAQSWLDRFAENKTLSLDDLCYSASCRRSHHNYRTAIVGNNFTEIRTQLEQFVSLGTGEWLASGKTVDNVSNKPVFVYTGMGPQWWAMGRELYAKELVFKEIVDRCDTIFRKLAGWSIRDEMLAEEEESRITETTIAQPANFVIQAGLTALLHSYGVEPAAIVGHSVGEVTAAYASGVLTLEEAIKVSYYRSQIQNKAAGQGKMLAVGVGLEQCEELLELTENKVSIAAINGPTSITLAGDSQSLEAISTYLTAINEFSKFLKVEVAYHSHFMDVLKPEVREKLADLDPSLPNIPLYSTVTGDLVEEVAYDAEYWCDNIRKPVYFAKSMQSLLRDGHRVFLEVGPHPVLSTSIKECCNEQNIVAQNIATRKRGAPEQFTFKLGMANLYTTGCNLDWRAFNSENAQYIKLPTYPWQREAYWSEMDDSISDRTRKPVHPLLDRRLRDPQPNWQGPLNRQYIPYLNDHQVDGLVIMPGAAYIEAGLASYYALSKDADSVCSMENIKFHQALIVESVSDPIIHVNLDDKTGEYSFFSRNQDELINWQLHASGTIKQALSVNQGKSQFSKISKQCSEDVDIGYLYGDLKARGLAYGPYFRTISQLKRGKNEILAKIELHSDLLDDSKSYHLHPCLLDGCFQSLISLIENDERFYMPVSIQKITYYSNPGEVLWCHGNLSQSNGKGINGSLSLYGEDGNLCVEIEGLYCRALQTEKEDPVEQLARLSYEWKWYPQALESDESNIGAWLVFSDDTAISDQLCTQLENETGNTVFQVKTTDIFQAKNPDIRTLDSDQIHHLKTILDYVSGKKCVGIAYLWSLNQQTNESDPTGIEQTSAALQITQLLGEIFSAETPRLYFVTQNAGVVKEADTINNLAQSSLIGFARVVHNEYPAFQCSLVDLDSQHIDVSLNQLKTELLSNNDEDDVAFRDSERLVHRLEHIEIPKDYSLNDVKSLNGAQTEAFQLDLDVEHAFKSISRVKPKVNEVEVKVNYAGLPSDINDSNQENLLGGYFATGCISKAGKKVTQFKSDDNVLIAAKGMPASHCTLPANQVFSDLAFKNIDQNNLVSLATSVLPTYYLLKYLANITPGNTVLVDVQIEIPAFSLQRICKWLEIDLIFYSAKKEILNAMKTIMGITILDSRKANFAGTLKKKTGKSEIQAWIHNGEEQPTFLDMSKANETCEIIINPASLQEVVSLNMIGTIIFRPDGLNIALSSPELFIRLLSEIAQHVNKDVEPLNISSLLSTEEMLEIASSEHYANDLFTPILSFENKEEILVAPSEVKDEKFDNKASYLITGGFGGFGLQAAKWLARRGVKHLILLGRRGAVSEEAKTTVASLKNQGVALMEATADISDKIQVARLFEQIKKEFPPLKGILHTAAILDDAPIRELNPCRLSTVMQAKAVGAWNLHQITKEMSLDFFVLFSSVSALIGNGRQSNYAAANTFLDTLACHRKAKGLPATSINWGAIATGMAVNSEEVRRHLENMGIYPVTTTQALDSWLGMNKMNLPQYGLMNTNWSRWQEFEPTGGNSPRFSKLMVSDEGGDDMQMTSICHEISGLPEGEQGEAMSEALCEQIAKILRIPVNKIDLQQSLTQLGVDSLMAAELQTAIYQVFGVRVSTLELLRGQKLSQLSKIIFDKSSISSPQKTEEMQEVKASIVDQLTDEDVEILLNRLTA